MDGGKLIIKETARVSYQARRQEFPEGGSSTRIGSRPPRGRGSRGLERPPEAQRVFGAKSFNLAISRHIHSNFRKSCFSKLIFKIFFLISHKMSTLLGLVLNSFQGGGRSNPSNSPWLRGMRIIHLIHSVIHIHPIIFYFCISLFFFFVFFFIN